jgi:two-component system phosphate regulon sensor histidine kinase PhoR
MIETGTTEEILLETGASGSLTEDAPPLCLSDDCHVFSSLLDETPQGIMVVDEECVISFVNLAMSVLFLPLRLVVGEKFASQKGLAPVARLIAEAREKQARVEGEMRFIADETHEAGVEHFYRVIASPWHEGMHAGFWVMVEDVTERVMTERIRQDFVTNAGHELRTPLSLIHGYIETLKGGLVKNPASLLRCLDVMEKHSRRMMRLIEDMLTISRLEGPDAQLRPEPFLVRGCVEDVLEHLTPLVEVRQPVIKLDFPPDGGLLQGDRFYWDQIFTNLIENALKENPRTGLRLTIAGRWTGNECIISVQDDGVGITAEDVPLVFKRFYRCAKDHSQEIRGTGLGLSIVRRAVEAHGGSIELESIPGVRTTFTIRLPLPE